MIKKMKVKEDISELFNSLENIHPNLYYNSDKKKMKFEIERLLEIIDTDMSEVELFRKVGPIISSFNDGHTACFPGKSYDEYINHGKTFLPLEVSFIEGNLVIEAVLCNDERFQNGNIIKSINGISSIEIVDKMNKYISGEDEIFKNALIGSYFRAFLWILFDMTDDFEIEVIKGEETKKYKLKGIEHSKIVEALNNLEKIDKKSRVDFIDDTAVITFESFENLEDEQKLIDSYFDEILERNSARLIIDLRNNGGGDSRVGDAILSRILAKPYRQYSSVEIKISEKIKEYYKNDEFIRGYYREFDPSILEKVENAAIDDIIKMDGQYIDNQMKDIYTGEVLLLTSSKTYSSASSFVTTFNDYKIGKIVGESPGGFSNSYGDVYMFKLANSNLEVFVSHKYHIRPNGNYELTKIVPHIQIESIKEMDIKTIIDLT